MSATVQVPTVYGHIECRYGLDSNGIERLYVVGEADPAITMVHPQDVFCVSEGFLAAHRKSQQERWEAYLDLARAQRQP